MRVNTFSHYKEVEENSIKNSYAIVIDLLRATSVMIAAISNGAKAIIPVEDIEEARLFKKLQPDVILGGERGAIKIEGFDLDNSPLSYKKEVVNGKTIVMTTTNGTRALKKSLFAKRIFTGSFINAKKTVDYIVKEIVNDNIDRISIICAGTEEKFTLEDILCAGYFVNILKNRSNVLKGEYPSFSEFTFDDLSIASYELYKKFENDPHEILKYSYHYNHLKNLGFGADLIYCLKKDFIDTVCEYKNFIVEKV